MKAAKPRRRRVRRTVRIDEDDAARLDRVAAAFQARQPAARITSADAARAAIRLGLDRLAIELNLHPEPPAPAKRLQRRKARSRSSSRMASPSGERPVQGTRRGRVRRRHEHHE